MPLLASGEVSGFQVPGAITSRCEAGLLRGTYKRCRGESTDLTYSSVVTDEQPTVGWNRIRPLTRQAVAARMARWGKAPDVRLYPHRCRRTHATHAIRRGVDVFTLSATLGHSSTGTTSNYVLAEPGESSSLKLG